MRRGELPVPDDDVAADRYLAADAALAAAGFAWYEVSNWARRRPRSAGTTCSTGAAATGGASGPGAHSHVGGVRWWNVKHPTATRPRLADGASPGQGRELLTAAERHTEDVMLRLRLADGLPLARWTGPDARRRPAPAPGSWRGAFAGRTAVLTAPRTPAGRRRSSATSCPDQVGAAAAAPSPDDLEVQRVASARPRPPLAASSAARHGPAIIALGGRRRRLALATLECQCQSATGRD